MQKESVHPLLRISHHYAVLALLLAFICLYLISFKDSYLAAYPFVILSVSLVLFVLGIVYGIRYKNTTPNEAFSGAGFSEFALIITISALLLTLSFG